MPPPKWSEWRTLSGPDHVYTSTKTKKMDILIGNNGAVQFANGKSSRDLRASSANLHERTDWKSVGGRKREFIGLTLVYTSRYLDTREEAIRTYIVTAKAYPQMNTPVVLVTGVLTGIGRATALSKLFEILIHSL